MDHRSIMGHDVHVKIGAFKPRISLKYIHHRLAHTARLFLPGEDQ